MITIDFTNKVYVCPYCGKQQAYSGSHDETLTRYGCSHPIPENTKPTHLYVYHIKCTNKECGNITVVGYLSFRDEQVDIIPQNYNSYKIYPDYIPKQIRDDYREAALIMSHSPKASATLLRRCLQGMIHDFWDIHEKNLNAEITTLKSKNIPSTQWAAIDGLRKLGNIGAHMEHDVNTIIDIDEGEAQKLMKLIELLIEKWYIARHDEEALFAEITGMADEKQVQRKGVPNE